MPISPRGYPSPSYGLPPAIPDDLQALAAAIDADMSTVEAGLWATCPFAASRLKFSESHQVPTVHRASSGLVTLVGVWKGSAATTVGMAQFTIPVGFRPSATGAPLLLGISGDGAPARFGLIAATGIVSFEAGGGSTAAGAFMALSASWRAA